MNTSSRLIILSALLSLLLMAFTGCDSSSQPESFVSPKEETTSLSEKHSISLEEESPIVPEQKPLEIPESISLFPEQDIALSPTEEVPVSQEQVIELSDEKTMNNEVPLELEPGTRKIIGFINSKEIGGKDLKFLSVHGEVYIGSNGEFTSVASGEGAQLIMISDAEENLRAMAVAHPLDGGKVLFDAKSTAKTAIFMTIGILTTDPDEAKMKLEKIENLSCFEDFHTYLKNQLPKKSIEQLGLKDFHSKYNELLLECNQEMMGAQ